MKVVKRENQGGRGGVTPTGAMRRMRVGASIGIMFGLALVSGCVCTSVDVENRTDQVLFANVADEENGELTESQGRLIPPGEDADLFIYGKTFIRVRDLTGRTVLFEELSGDEDANVVVESLEPAAGAPTPGVPFVGRLGPRSMDSTYRETCKDGEHVNVQLFGTAATVMNDSAEPLILSLWSGESHEGDQGTLVIPGGHAVLYGLTTNEPWLLANDQDGHLRLSAPLRPGESQNVVIPRVLPTSPAIPQSPYDNSCTGLGELLPWNW